MTMKAKEYFLQKQASNESFLQEKLASYQFEAFLDELQKIAHNTGDLELAKLASSPESQALLKEAFLGQAASKAMGAVSGIAGKARAAISGAGKGMARGVAGGADPNLSRLMRGSMMKEQPLTVPQKKFTGMLPPPTSRPGQNVRNLRSPTPSPADISRYKAQQSGARMPGSAPGRTPTPSAQQMAQYRQKQIIGRMPVPKGMAIPAGGRVAA